MNTTPDAWQDEWSTVADTSSSPSAEVAGESKNAPTKISKAQRRAQQAEFNRQIWAQAEGPQETNFFLESRNVVPLRSEYKAPPILLSRKGPTIAVKRPPRDDISNLNIQDESSDDEEDGATKPLTLAERQAQAAKEREEKQRKYDERRQELFGTSNTIRPKSSSGNSSPVSLTPPSSRSATPNRGRGKGGVRRGGLASMQSQPKQKRELFDPKYSPKPDSIYLQRRENGLPKATEAEIQPIRAPRGPDGSGRGGFGFVAREARPTSAQQEPFQVVEST